MQIQFTFTMSFFPTAVLLLHCLRRMETTAVGHIHGAVMLSTDSTPLISFLNSPHDNLQGSGRILIEQDPAHVVDYDEITA